MRTVKLDKVSIHNREYDIIPIKLSQKI